MPDNNDQLRPALFRAEATLRAVEDFVRTFAEPGGPEQLAALLAGKRFRRTLLGDNPRAVAVEHLVRPCLQALGYAAPGADPGPDRPRFRLHPGALPERDGTDGRTAASSDGQASTDALAFELATPDPPLAGVVAVAAPNAESVGDAERPDDAGLARDGSASDAGRPDDAGPATAAVRGYLADEGVATTMLEATRERGNDRSGTPTRGDRPPVLAGVATDGLRWSVWARSPAAGAPVRRVGSVTLKGIVESVADALVLDGDPAARWRVHARRDVDGTLASLLAAERFPSRARETVESRAGDDGVGSRGDDDGG